MAAPEGGSYSDPIVPKHDAASCAGLTSGPTARTIDPWPDPPVARPGPGQSWVPAWAGMTMLGEPHVIGRVFAPLYVASALFTWPARYSAAARSARHRPRGGRPDAKGWSIGLPRARSPPSLRPCLPAGPVWTSRACRTAAPIKRANNGCGWNRMVLTGPMSLGGDQDEEQ